MYNIRPFNPTDEEYEQIHKIRLAALPRYPITLKTFRHYDTTRDSKYPYHRDVIEKDGEIIGYGAYWQSGWSYHPDKYAWDVFVHPEHEAPEVYAVHFEHTLKTLSEKIHWPSRLNLPNCAR